MGFRSTIQVITVAVGMTIVHLEAYCLDNHSGDTASSIDLVLEAGPSYAEELGTHTTGLLTLRYCAFEDKDGSFTRALHSLGTTILE